MNFESIFCYLLASVSSRVSITNSKVEPAPSKIEMTTDMYLETLGEGLKLRTHSFKLYSQGFEMLIDEVLNRYSDYQVASPEVKAEIQKIAQMINLKKITRPSQAMAFVQHNLIGYEYAATINYEHVLPALKYEPLQEPRSLRRPTSCPRARSRSTAACRCSPQPRLRPALRAAA